MNCTVCSCSLWQHWATAFGRTCSDAFAQGADGREQASQGSGTSMNIICTVSSRMPRYVDGSCVSNVHDQQRWYDLLGNVTAGVRPRPLSMAPALEQFGDWCHPMCPSRCLSCQRRCQWRCGRQEVRPALPAAAAASATAVCLPAHTQVNGLQRGERTLDAHVTVLIVGSREQSGLIMCQFSFRTSHADKIVAGLGITCKPRTQRILQQAYCCQAPTWQQTPLHCAT
jgi:hypothetical protein